MKKKWKHVWKICLLVLTFSMFSALAAQAAETPKPVAVNATQSRDLLILFEDNTLWYFDGTVSSIHKLMDDVAAMDIADSYRGAVLKTDGSLWLWEDKNGQAVPINSYSAPSPERVAEGVSKVYADPGRTYIYAIKNDGSLWTKRIRFYQDAAGVNYEWQKITEDVAEVTGVSGSKQYILKNNGSLVAWSSSDLTAKEIMADVKQASYDSFANEGLALKNDGTLWYWDWKSSRFTQVMDQVAYAQCGYTGTCAAIKTDGSLWTWGSNRGGGLGDGTKTDRKEPGKILDDVVQVDIGIYCGAAITKDGSVWNWGSTGDGSVRTPEKISLDGVSSMKVNDTFQSGNMNFRVSSINGKTGSAVVTGSAKKNAKAIKIPDTVVQDGNTFQVTAVADKAFYKNKKLQQVTFGKNIVSVGENAFSGCTSLTKVSLNASLTDIGGSAFEKCTKLKSIMIPKNVKTIGTRAFFGDKNLIKIQIKSTKLQTIQAKALKGIHQKAVIQVPPKKFKQYKKILKGKGQSKTVKITK